MPEDRAGSGRALLVGHRCCRDPRCREIAVQGICSAWAETARCTKLTQPRRGRLVLRHRGAQPRGCHAGRRGLRGVLLSPPHFRNSGLQGDKIRDERQ